MPTVTFILPGFREVRAQALAGTTLLEAARLARVDIEGACGGSMACATCHLHVPDEWWPRLPRASREEEDVLDFATDWCKRSRLACQIRLTQALDGLRVVVPASTLAGG